MLSFVGELEKILMEKTNPRAKPMKTIVPYGTETVIAMHQGKQSLTQEMKSRVKPMKVLTELGTEFDVLRMLGGP